MRALRELAGLSQAGLGRLIGVGKSAVYRWEAGEVEPSSVHQGKIEAVSRSVAEALTLPPIERARRVRAVLAPAAPPAVRRGVPASVRPHQPPPRLGRPCIEYVGYSRPRVQVPELRVVQSFVVWVYGTDTRWAIAGQGSEFPAGAVAVEWCLPVPPLRLDYPAIDTWPSLDALREALTRCEYAAALTFRGEFDDGAG